MVELLIDPGPQPISEILHNSDTRRVSIYVQNPTFVETH
jgi:hypothetical protein